MSFHVKLTLVNSYVMIINRLPYTNGNKTRFIKTEDILYIKADGNYCEIIMEDSKSKILIRKTITKLTEELNNNIDSFIKINRSLAVNINHIEEIIKSGYNEAHVKVNNNLFRISKSHKNYLFFRLGLSKRIV